MKHVRVTVAPTLLLGLVLATSFAITPASAATRDEQTKACRGDALKFCSAEIPDEGKITACMKQNLSKLSPECRAMFGKQK